MMGALGGSDKERCLPTSGLAMPPPDAPPPLFKPLLGKGGGLGLGGGRLKSMAVPYVSLLIIELGMGGLCLSRTMEAASRARAARLGCRAALGTKQLMGRSSRRLGMGWRT